MSENVTRALRVGHNVVEIAREVVAASDRLKVALAELDAVVAVPLDAQTRNTIRLVKRALAPEHMDSHE